MAKQSTTRPPKTPLTDAERHERFVQTAREVEADENPASFERAFANVVTPPKSNA